MSDGPQQRNARRAKEALEGQSAMRDYLAQAEKRAANTARLRAMRLAHEAEQARAKAREAGEVRLEGEAKAAPKSRTRKA